MKIQHAWCQQDMQPTRAFVSDGIFERFTLQIQEQKALGYRDHMEQIRINSLHLANAEVDAEFDVVTVRIAASAVDYRVALHAEKHNHRNAYAGSFVEFWSYIRKRGVLSRSVAGLMEGNCPKCNASVTRNPAATCEACGNLLPSGEYDWVLCAITQECAWVPTENQKIPGLDEFRKQDPHCNQQQIENITAVIFWRRAMADHVGQVAPLKKVATPEFCNAYERGLRSAAQGNRLFYGDCVMNAVNLAALIPADSNSPWDRAVVEVRWSGKNSHGNPTVTSDVPTKVACGELSSSSGENPERTPIRNTSSRLHTSAIVKYQKPNQRARPATCAVSAGTMKRTTGSCSRRSTHRPPTLCCTRPTHAPQAPIGNRRKTLSLQK